MNIDEKILKKCYQTESNNSLKGSYTMIKWDLSQGCKDSSFYVNQSMWYTTLTNWRIKSMWSSQSVQFSHSVVSTLFDPMDCSTPGFPVHHQFPEFTQTHVHWVGDAIQPSHPLSSPSPSAFNHSQHQGFFKWVSFCIRWPKYYSFSFSISPSNEYSGLISFRMDWMDLFAVQGTLKSINYSVLSFLYSSMLTSIHDYWKNHTLD